MSYKNKPWVEEMLVILLLSTNIIIIIAIISPFQSASGQKQEVEQQEEDSNLSFIKNLNPSSYSKVVEDVHFVQKIASAVREVGNAIMSNPSLCSITDDIDRCGLVALSLTNYLSDYNFENAVSKMNEAKNLLAEFQENPTFEGLDGFAKANSDIAKSLYELLTEANSILEGIDKLHDDDNNNSNEAASSSSTLSIILIEAGQMTNNNEWISFGQRLMTLFSNFEQKYSEINAITGIVNSVDVGSLPRNEFGFYVIGFGIAGILVAVGIIIQLLLRRRKK
ncbi:MAG TPA: hypothetical protein VJ250_06710 [Nitrososphaeraceae archaeon]|nr:hypothetical protein [Nitrososphaeraceae archaeon]